MEGGFSTQVILAKSQAIVDDGFSPDVGIVIDLLPTKESIQGSMIPVALKEQAGLYIYRFQVPIGGAYRFRLSSRLSPSTKSKRQPSATQLIDYAISRAAAEEGGICANHFQPLTNGNELHLGEADYLALLVHGQCACSTTATAGGNDYKKVDCCYKRSFDGDRGREIGDAPGPGAAIALNGRGGQMILSEELGAWPEDSEQRRWAYGEQSQKTADEQVASFPEPDKPATALDAPAAAMEGSGSRQAVKNVDDSHEEEEAKWSGMYASGEDGDCLQRRRLHQQGTIVQMKPGEEEVEVEELELERDPLLTLTSRAHDASWSKDSTELFNRRFRLGQSGIGTRSGRTPAGDEHSSTRGAVHPDAVLAAPGDEPWTSAAEATYVARQTYVFERCQRNCVQASDKDNILFAVFDDHHAFFLPQLNDNFRQSLCSAELPLPSDIVKDLLQVLSGSKFFGLLDESDSAEPRHPIEGSDFEPLLLSTVESSDPVLTTDAEIAIKPHESKDPTKSVHNNLRQTLSSEDSEAVPGSASSSATRAIGVETEAADAIIAMEDVEIECDNVESFHVDLQLRLRFWRRARLAVMRAFQRIRDFFRGLFLGRGHFRPSSCDRRRSRLSQPSSTSRAGRVECYDLSKY